jgi:hypothetical protein
MAKKKDTDKHDETQKLLDAAARGAVDEVVSMIEAGVLVDSRDKNDKTALMITAEAGHLELVETLLNLEADVNAKDHNGETPAMYAALAGRLDVLQVFKSRGADLHFKNSKGQNAQHLADEIGETAVVAWLSAQSAPSSATGSAEIATEVDDDDPTTIGPAAAGNPPEADAIEAVDKSDLFDPWQEPDEAEVANGHGPMPDTVASFVPSAAAMPALTPTEPSAEAFIDPEVSAQLADRSPDYFGKTTIMSAEEIVERCDSTDQQCDSLIKSTSRLLAQHFRMDKDLLSKIQSVDGRKTHIGTIRRWNHAGTAMVILEDAGKDTRPFNAYQLEAMSRLSDKQAIIDLAEEVAAKKLSVRDINKKVAPLVRRAKLEESGQLREMSPLAIGIIEALEDPESLMRHSERSLLLQNGERLGEELSFAELSRIHEKAGAVEVRRAKQKRTLEEKAENYLPVINFLRLIRRTISNACEGGTD